MLSFTHSLTREPFRCPFFPANWNVSTLASHARRLGSKTRNPVSNLISMDERISKPGRRAPVRDRRYAIRYPFAADVQLLDLESGARADGVTSDISMGGCFICTSKPFPVGARARVTFTRKSQSVEALAVVRIVKPRIGMGIEFIDLNARDTLVLTRWIDVLRQTR